MKELELYIVRHGQTDWNLKGLLQGSVDIELNSNGRQAAGEYGRKLEDTDFDCIYSSPLIRAYETACLIRGHRNIPIIRDDRLREISFGILEGTTNFKNDPNKEIPYRYFFDEPDKYEAPPEGEEISSVMERAKDFITDEIEKLYKNKKRIMIVAHGALNKGLMCYLQGNDQKHFWGDGLQNNCDATIFTYDGQNWKLK